MNDARARPTLEAAISSNCGAITVARQLEFSVCLSYGYAHGRETAHHRGRSSTKRKPNNERGREKNHRYQRLSSLRPEKNGQSEQPRYT